MPLALAFCVAVFWGAFAWWDATVFAVPDAWLVGGGDGGGGNS
jgi:hypothetical protein